MSPKITKKTLLEMIISLWEGLPVASKIEEMPSNIIDTRKIDHKDIYYGFSSTSIRQYEKIINVIFLIYPQLDEMISYIHLDLAFGEFIGTIKFENKKFDSSLWDVFIGKLKNEPIKECEAFRPLDMAPLFSRFPITIGIFTFYLTKELFSENSMVKNGISGPNSRMDKSNFIVGVKYKAVDNDKILEYADIRIERLKKLLKIFSFSPQVQNKKAEKIDRLTRETLLVFKDSTYYNPDQKYIKKYSSLVDYPPVIVEFIKIIGKRQSVLKWHEKRMLIAINSFGIAKDAEERINAFLHFMIGIEGLLQTGKDYVKKQIQEHAAFLLSDSKIERLEISKAIGNLYDTRSKISHGEQDYIGYSEVKAIEGFSIMILLSFYDRTQAMESENDFVRFLYEQKYWGTSDN